LPVPVKKILLFLEKNKNKIDSVILSSDIKEHFDSYLDMDTMIFNNVFSIVVDWNGALRSNIMIVKIKNEENGLRLMDMTLTWDE